MLGIVIFALLIIFIAACITPWWFIPTLIVVSILWAFLSPLKN